MKQDQGKKLSTQTVFEGRVFKVVVDRVRLPHGREVNMEIIRHPASVVLLPMPDPDHVILIRQYRYSIDRWIWEAPAGSIDAGENPQDAARRECEEEIGLTPARAIRLAALLPTPGYCDEEMIFYKLTDLSEPGGEIHKDEDEQIEPRTFSIAEARQMVARGEIVDMKTVVGLTLI